MKVDTSANIHPQSTALVDQYYKNKKTNAPFYSDTEYKKSFESKEVNSD